MKYTWKNKKLILIVVLVLLVAMLSTTLYGCGLIKIYGESDLISLMNELAVTMFTGDGLSINILLENPEKFGLSGQPASLPIPNFDKSSYENNMRGLGGIVDVFKMINYKKLSTTGKRDYDTVVDYFTTYSKYADFYYLDNRDYIGVNDGWNVLLPLYLDKLAFKTENDVKNWLLLADGARSAFLEYARFEREILIPAGYTRSKSVYLQIAEQCQNIAEKPEDGNHFLYDVFADKIQKVTFLDSTQKAEYLAKAETAVDNLITAYTTLADDVTTISATAPEENTPLAHYAEGKAYYSLLFSDNASSSDGVEMAYENLKAAFNETIEQARVLNAQLPEGFELEKNMSMEALQGYYDLIKSKYTQDFPALHPNTPDATFHTVPEAMSDFYNPASYFKSAVDSVSAPETIYVNPGNAGGYYGFDIIAHEGIPGHMLQHAYFKSTGANMLRTLLGYIGYAEGWASYAQYYSAKYFEGTDEEKIAFQVECLLDQANTYLYTIIDIEINYFGRSKEWFMNHEVYSQIFSDYMYEYMVMHPAVYASYGYGNYKMEALRDAFTGSDLDFHKAVLSAGPTTYEILAKYILG